MVRSLATKFRALHLELVEVVGSVYGRYGGT